MLISTSSSIHAIARLQMLILLSSLPGADRLSKKTGAIIIGNGEAINVMRTAGVPEHQLMAISGGERIPLFSKQQWSEADISFSSSGPAHSPSVRPGPATPQPEDAIITVHAWPSLHALMPPGDHHSLPEIIDSSTVYTGSGSHQCTLDITRGLTNGLGSLLKLNPLPSTLPQEMKEFASYMQDRESNRYSFYDGGQIMYNFLIGGKALLWNGHLGGYGGILKCLEPKPDIAILAIAGRANLDGRPFDGSAAEFVVKTLKWLGEPSKIIWCLHDRAPMKPNFIDVSSATQRVENETRGKVISLVHAELYTL
jgi:hypothetical protein